MKSLSRENQADIIEAFNSTSRYLDDLLNIDNIYFEKKCFYFNNYVSYTCIQLTLDNRLSILLGKDYQICLPFYLFAAIISYLSVFPFDVESFM